MTYNTKKNIAFIVAMVGLVFIYLETREAGHRQGQVAFCVAELKSGFHAADVSDAKVKVSVPVNSYQQKYWPEMDVDAVIEGCAQKLFAQQAQLPE